MNYTLYFLFGRYDIVRIDRVIGSIRAIGTVVSTGRAVTVRLKDCYGRFEFSGDARKAANKVNRIHQRHAPAVKQALTAHTEAVRNRNRDVLEYLHEIRSSQLSHPGNPDGPGQSANGKPDGAVARSGHV